MLYFSGMDTTLVVCTPLGAVVWFPTAVEDLLVVWIPPRPFLVSGRGLHTTWSGGMLYISGIDTTLAFFLHNRLGVWGGGFHSSELPRRQAIRLTAILFCFASRSTFRRCLRRASRPCRWPKPCSSPTTGTKTWKYVLQPILDVTSSFPYFAVAPNLVISSSFMA